jgi:hypothetical protein
LNDDLSNKIERDICRLKKNEDYLGGHQTCSIKEDLNLILSIDISSESRAYYRSYSVAIVQEVLRSFEFKWDEQNLLNERLNSRIRVFGIRKPRRNVQKLKLFDTLDNSMPLVDGLTKLENWLSTIQIKLMDPKTALEKPRHKNIEILLEKQTSVK